MPEQNYKSISVIQGLHGRGICVIGQKVNGISNDNPDFFNHFRFESMEYVVIKEFPNSDRADAIRFACELVIELDCTLSVDRLYLDPRPLLSPQEMWGSMAK